MKKANLMFLAILSQTLLGASYYVPVPGDLDEHARWDSIEASAQITGNKLNLKYELPADLIGTAFGPVIATGLATPSPFIPVSGNKVSGVCMRAQLKPLTCVLHYPKSIVDIATRNESIRGHFSGSELIARTEVARLFGADPAGLLSVDLK